MLKLADMIVDVTKPDSEDWVTKLQVLRRDIVSSTSSISLEAANSKLNLLDINLRFQDIVTTTD